MRVGMFESFITQHWFSAQAKAIWSDEATLQAWLDVEAALAQAQAHLGIIPSEAAAVIGKMAHVRHFDCAQLSQDIAFAQHPLVPVLRRLEQLCGEPAAGYIHWGATTQNIFDTASAVQMHRSHALTMGGLSAGMVALEKLALEHKDAPMAGRTHGQHALPMTFGFKVAAWLDELGRAKDRLHGRLNESFTASMGGAIGTFAAVGSIGPAVEAAVATQLGLTPPTGLPIRSAYDRVSDYVSALAMLAATLQKIAQDIVFMQRTEIGEVAEAFHMGKVGSSTMAQKRNPSTALLLISLARMLRSRGPVALEAMVRMDEGDSSSTNVTDILLPEIGILAASVCETFASLAQGLVVFPDKMHQNLELTNGLIASESAMMQLTQLMGRHQAHHLLYEAAQRAQSSGMPFIEAILSHPHFTTHSIPAGLAESLVPTKYVGSSAELTITTVERVRAGGQSPG